MGHGLYNGMNAPWVIDCTTVYTPHGSWTVQQCIYLMGHGPYNNSVGMGTPWVMDRTTIWIVQQYIYSITHGLYNGIPTPWVMGHAIV